MFKAFRRFWKYLTAKMNSSFNEKADPKTVLAAVEKDANDYLKANPQWSILSAADYKAHPEWLKPEG